MTVLPGQPPPGPTLTRAFRLLHEGKPDEADALLKAAAVDVRGKHGSGSHPLALAYADIARLHAAAGDPVKAANGFRHICDYPMPADPAGRRDRLAFMFGFGGCVEAAGRADEAEKVFHQCVAFAKGVFGAGSPGYAAALEPLAGLLLRQGKTGDAVRLLDEAYDTLWKHGDRQVVAVLPARAEALKAAGRADNPFTDLAQLPEDLGTAVVARVIGRGKQADPVRHRQVLADLLTFAEKKFGPDHPNTANALAAVVRHEAVLGAKADPAVRAAAVRRAVWAYAARQLPGGLLADLDVGFDPDGAVHLVPRLARDATPAEVEKVQQVLTWAVDDLYSRPVPEPTM
jgi:hypothetical protein